MPQGLRRGPGTLWAGSRGPCGSGGGGGELAHKGVGMQGGGWVGGRRVAHTPAGRLLRVGDPGGVSTNASFGGRGECPRAPRASAGPEGYNQQSTLRRQRRTENNMDQRKRNNAENSARCRLLPLGQTAGWVLAVRGERVGGWGSSGRGTCGIHHHVWGRLGLGAEEHHPLRVFWGQVLHDVA
jgi:hypothetical protein